MPAYAKSPTRFRNPGSRPKIVLACACQRCGGRLYARRENRKAPCRKIVLRLPDLDQTKSAVLNSLSSPCSRRNDEFAMEQFIAWYCSEPRLALNRAVILRFRLHLESLGLAAGTINQRLAAVRRLAYEAADSGLLSTELAAGIRRVKGVKQLGARTGNWLTRDQAGLLLEKADGDDLRSLRDLAMIVNAAGLRIATCRAICPDCGGHADQTRTLGDCGSCRQGWSRSDRAHAQLGQRGGGPLDDQSRGQRRSDLSGR